MFFKLILKPAEKNQDKTDKIFYEINNKGIDKIKKIYKLV